MQKINMKMELHVVALEIIAIHKAIFKVIELFVYFYNFINLS